MRNQKLGKGEGGQNGVKMEMLTRVSARERGTKGEKNRKAWRRNGQ